MAKRPTKGDWKLYVSVPSQTQARRDAKRVSRWCDKTKVQKSKNGWYEVWMLNPSQGAKIILGL